jgi:hypothetical protein
VAFSALVAISSAGVHAKMSHSAASTGRDSRSGVPVTSRQTCTEDSGLPGVVTPPVITQELATVERELTSPVGLHRHEPVEESGAVQPHPVPDQQLNGRLRVPQPHGMRSQRRRQLIETRSKSGSPSI